jgi:hypothetical protein
MSRTFYNTSEHLMVTIGWRTGQPITSDIVCLLRSAFSDQLRFYFVLPDSRLYDLIDESGSGASHMNSHSVAMNHTSDCKTMVLG